MGNHPSGITKSSAINEGDGNQEKSSILSPSVAVSSVNSRICYGDSALSFSLQNQEKPDPILPLQNHVVSSTNDHASSSSPSDYVEQLEVKIDVPILECSVERRNGSDDVADEDVSIQNDRYVIISEVFQVSLQCSVEHRNESDDGVNEDVSIQSDRSVINSEVFQVSLQCSVEHRNGSDDGVDEDVPIKNDQSVINSVVKINSEVKLDDEKEIKCVVDEGKWIKDYHSSHKILLVGEGDFSFSSSFALAFGSASNMIATSLNSRKFLKKNYRTAMANIQNLRSMGCMVKHGIDATQIACHELLGGMKFDRIVFNFPFAGFFKDLSRDAQLRKHRRLVSLFLKNAKQMIGENGEIHISHKTNGFHLEWKLEHIASSHGLRLIEAVKFNRFDYPGYYTKRGFGGDGNFNCNPAKTYKFGLKSYQS